MQGVEPVRQERVRAVDRQHVLGQVVGADREEIRMRREPRRVHGGGGRFDHDADRDARIAARARRDLAHQRAHRLDLGGLVDHRQQDPAAAGGPHGQDGRELRAQDVRAPQAGADAAQPERRIVLVRHREERDRLVAAGVERAHHDRAAGHGVRNRLVLRELLRARPAARCGRGTGTRCAGGRNPRRRRRPRRRPPPPSPRWPTPRFARRPRCGSRAPPRPANARARRSRAAMRERSSASSAGPGAISTRPRSASTTTVVPSGTSSSEASTPASMGRPCAPARIATCEVAARLTVQMPAIRVTSSAMNWEGSRSRATRIAPAGREGAEVPVAPASSSRSCSSRSRRSSARAAKCASSTEPSARNASFMASRHANPALRPAPTCR